MYYKGNTNGQKKVLVVRAEEDGAQEQEEEDRTDDPGVRYGFLLYLVGAVWRVD